MPSITPGLVMLAMVILNLWAFGQLPDSPRKAVALPIMRRLNMALVFLGIGSIVLALVVPSL